MRIFPLITLLLLFITACNPEEKVPTDWQLTGFIKIDANNPVLTPDTTTLFVDPIKGDTVKWEGKDVFNPASVVRNDTLFLLYRAEDFVGRYNGTSRIGLAYSLDGLHFIRYPQPVFFPQEDEAKIYEWEGGAEDPRIVEDENGRYIMTYTGYDGDLARLLLATSNDLINWTKYGSAFARQEDIDRWSKSGSIVSEMSDGRLMAKKINGQYWMYFGDTDLFLATSDDLIKWTPVKDADGEWIKVLSPREGKFDSDLVEPGPPAMLTKNGILLIYNSRNALDDRYDPTLAHGTYSAGQVLFDPEHPERILARAEDYFFTPDKDYEITGQVNNVCFLEGLSLYKGQWFVYYGTADSKIAVAVAPERDGLFN